MTGLSSTAPAANDAGLAATACQRGFQLPLLGIIVASGLEARRGIRGALSAGWSDGSYRAAIDDTRRQMPNGSILYDVRADLNHRSILSVYREQRIIIDAGVLVPIPVSHTKEGGGRLTTEHEDHEAEITDHPVARSPHGTVPERLGGRRWTFAFVGSVVGAMAALAGIEDPLLARGTALAVVYVLLALTEVVPPFVPTLFLLVVTPLALGPLASAFSLGEVMRWAADPVLLLFGGGLTLGVAAQRHGLDLAIANAVVRMAAGRSRRLLALAMAGTALMSMWMSNIAAAAMMIAVLRPLWQQPSAALDFRRAVLLGVAVGANIGGIATPIGTGPNAIAIAAVAPAFKITFLHWMSFALPLVVGMLALSFVLLSHRYRIAGTFYAPSNVVAESRGRWSVVAIFSLAVLAWLTEPLHGISAPLVAASTALLLFASGVLARTDLNKIDWSTLGLIAGGIMVGRLLEKTGVLELSAAVEWTDLPRGAWLGALVVASASLSALMSNTGTAALLVPMGLTIDPAPDVAVLIAVAASFGMPFSISTPPNAMAYGEGGLRSSDLLFIGLTMMIFGSALVVLTGTPVLRMMGIP